MRLIIALSCLSLCQWSQALAADPAPAAATAPAATSADSTPAPSATASAATSADSKPAPSAATASATTSSSSSYQAVTPEIDKRLRSQGYKREVRKGDLFYCRNETILGSHFEQKTCKTAERILAESANAQDMMTRAQVETLQTAKP